MSKRFQRGAASIEMVLVGIPTMFVLISIFEISRGMWMYHTLAYAAREGVRFAAVHGVDCGMIGPIANTCQKDMQGIAQEVEKAGVGLDLTTTSLTFNASGNTGTCLLSDLVGNNASCPAKYLVWPPAGANGVGQPIEIQINTLFKSALAMFWPGSHPVSFATVNLWASSSDRIQF